MSVAYGNIFTFDSAAATAPFVSGAFIPFDEQNLPFKDVRLTTSFLPFPTSTAPESGAKVYQSGVYQVVYGAGSVTPQDTFLPIGSVYLDKNKQQISQTDIATDVMNTTLITICDSDLIYTDVFGQYAFIQVIVGNPFTLGSGLNGPNVATGISASLTLIKIDEIDLHHALVNSQSLN